MRGPFGGPVYKVAGSRLIDAPDDWTVIATPGSGVDPQRVWFAAVVVEGRWQAFCRAEPYNAAPDVTIARVARFGWDVTEPVARAVFSSVLTGTEGEYGGIRAEAEQAGESPGE